MKTAERERERKNAASTLSKAFDVNYSIIPSRVAHRRANCKKVLRSNRLRINTRIANSVIQCGASKIIHFRTLIQFRFAFHFISAASSFFCA